VSSARLARGTPSLPDRRDRARGLPSARLARENPGFPVAARPQPQPPERASTPATASPSALDALDPPRPLSLALRGAWIGTIVLTAGLLGWNANAHGLRVLPEIATYVGGSFLGGKFLIFSGINPNVTFSPWGLALLMSMIDLHFAFLTAWALSRFERHRRIGGWIRNSRLRAHKLLIEYPGFRRMAFWGVAFFVFLPLPGSGAVTGSFAGRLMGMPRLTAIVSITIGSIAVSLLFATFAEILGEQGEHILENRWLSLAIALVFAATLWAAYARVKVMLRRPH